MIQNKTGNNLDLDVAKYLNEHFKDWTKEIPQIYELDENLNPIKLWPNKLAIKEHYRIKFIQAVDISVRNSVRVTGRYFCIKYLYDKLGLRPTITKKRNEIIYAYNPNKETLDKFNNNEKLFAIDFFKEGIREKFELIGRFPNSVSCANYLDLSITNIRGVAKRKMLFHKDYFFSFKPLLSIHKVESDIFDLSRKSEDFSLSNIEVKLLEDSLEIFKEDINIERIRGYAEEKLLNTYLKFPDIENFLNNFNDSSNKEENIDI